MVPLIVPGTVSRGDNRAVCVRRRLRECTIRAIGAVALCMMALCRVPAQVTNVSPPDLPRWIGVTLNGDTVSLRNSDAVVCIVFFNTYSCRDCFATVDSLVSRVRSKGATIKLYVLVRVSGGVLANRRAERSVLELMPHVDAVLYDAVDAARDAWPPGELTGGLFGFYGVSKTPVVLILRDADPTFLDYEAVNNVPGNSDGGLTQVERSLMSSLGQRVPR